MGQGLWLGEGWARTRLLAELQPRLPQVAGQADQGDQVESKQGPAGWSLCRRFGGRQSSRHSSSVWKLFLLPPQPLYLKAEQELLEGS